MILGIIILTASMLGLGYVMYNSNVESKEDSSQQLQHELDDWNIYEEQPNYSIEVVEGEVDKLLHQLVEHLHAYGQYYEQKVWECHNCILLTEQCMALEAGSEERLALYQVMKHDVTQFNRYMRVMKPYSQNELDQGWSIALELKHMHSLNTEQAALLAECWEQIVPYVISEKYMHTILEDNVEYRAELVEWMKLNVIQTKREYGQNHKEMLHWEYEYAHIKAETIITTAELETAKLDMEVADHALALILAENENLGNQTLVNAYAEAAQQALILKQAEVKAAEVDMARMQLETAKMDMDAARFEQTLMEHHQPGDALHPNLPQGARIVPGNNTPPPQLGGSWWSEFVEWIWSWFS